MEVRLRDIFVSSFFYPSLSPIKCSEGGGECRNDSLELTMYNRLALNARIKAGATTNTS